MVYVQVSTKRKNKFENEFEGQTNHQNANHHFCTFFLVFSTLRATPAYSGRGISDRVVLLSAV